MGETVPFINAQGKREMVPATEAIARQMVRALPEMTPREQIAALKAMDTLGLSNELRRRDEAANPPLTREQIEERVIAKLAELKRLQANTNG